MADEADASGSWLDNHFPLHKAVFNNDIKQMEKLLSVSDSDIDIDQQDTHGNTALHLAALLGHKEAAELLLANHAKVCVKNNDGWKSLHEAISYGDRQMIALLLVAHKRQSHHELVTHLPELSDHFAQLDDFYMELKWEFHTWIPLLSRIMPSDTFKVFKGGNKFRVDFTLIDFNERLAVPSWIRGDMSLLFDPAAEKGKQTVLMDNQLGVYQRVRDKNRHLDEELDLLMSSDIISTHISTRPIQFIRVKNFFFGAKTDKVGDYQADFYQIKGMYFVTRKRREHLTQADLKRNRAVKQAFSNGKLPAVNCDEHQEIEHSPHRKSLSPPPRPSMNWSQYLRVPDAIAHLGRPKQEKENAREVKGFVAICDEFPLSTEHILHLLELLQPVNPTIKKLRTFCSSRLPPGFPIRFEIPVFATISAKVSFQQFQWRTPEESFAAHMFQIPDHFKEDTKRFQNM